MELMNFVLGQHSRYEAFMLGTVQGTDSILCTQACLRRRNEGTIQIAHNQYASAHLEQTMLLTFSKNNFNSNLQRPTHPNTNTPKSRSMRLDTIRIWRACVSLVWPWNCMLRVTNWIRRVIIFEIISTSKHSALRHSTSMVNHSLANRFFCRIFVMRLSDIYYINLTGNERKSRRWFKLSTVLM